MKICINYSSNTSPFSNPDDFVGYQFSSTGYDTVLELYEDVCGSNDNVINCNDDATPPGDQ